MYKICFDFTKLGIWNIFNVGKRTKERIYNMFTYLYSKRHLSICWNCGNCMIFDIEGPSIYKVVLWEKTSVCWRCIFGWQRFWDYHQKSLATQFSLFTFFSGLYEWLTKNLEGWYIINASKKGDKSRIFQKRGIIAS